MFQPDQRVLSTLEQDGSRRWLRPKLAIGRFWKSRRITAYILIAVFTLLPYLKINHKPAILLDIFGRKFTIFGLVFLPTDTALLALFLVTVGFTIFFLTALFGRVWCGWACPQTVYLEFLYRPIERLMGTTHNKKASGWRSVVMYALFLLVSLYLANTFLAYFVGVGQLRHWVFGSPVDHPVSFIVVMIITGAMMFDFGWFREQMCTIACPYGRIQSVLTDRHSLAVTYDVNRGEPRGKMTRSTPLSVVSPESSVLPRGDCVDCGMCEAACPTGIDIRKGYQPECIACAQCIDACDAVMDKIGRSRGLIRFSSVAAMAGEPQRLMRPRVYVYASVIVLLGSLLTFLIATKPQADVTVMRNVGRPFVITDNGLVENTMRVKITNRTEHAMRLHFSIQSRTDVRAIASQQVVELAPGVSTTEPVQILSSQNIFTMGSADITLRVQGEDGMKIDNKCRILGPVSFPGANQ